jgi:hypothetical protein
LHIFTYAHILRQEKEETMKTIKLETIEKKTMIYKIAEAILRYRKFYECMIEGEKVKVVR